MKAETCNRCSSAVKVTHNKLCGGCLELLGYEAEAAAVKNWEAEYQKAYDEAATAERERLFSILNLPEASGRRALAIKLCQVPTMTAEKALSILALALSEQATGPAAEFRAVMARLHPEPPAVEGNEEAEMAAFVTRMQKYDEKDQAERAEDRARRRRED